RALNQLESLAELAQADTAPRSSASTPPNAVGTSAATNESSKRPPVITLETIAAYDETPALLYDKSGEEHYNVVSALIKSMRASDPDAAIYWLMRMLEAGDDPLFVMRRLIIFASEDVGNADPRALQVALNADQA